MVETTRVTTPWLVVAVSLPSALAPLNSTMVAVALPDATLALGADSGVVRQGLVTSYLLTNIVLQSPGGKLGDLLGHRHTLGMGQLVFALGAALAYLWPALPVLTVSRIVMAAGGAIVVPSAMALLRTLLPPEKRGRAFGSFGAVMALSAATGPKVGALLVERFGWESIFVANVPVIFVAMLVTRAVLPSEGSSETSPRTRPRFDVIGSVLLGASLTALVIGSESNELRLLIAAGALGLLPFALWERKASDPVVDPSLFRERAFLGGTLVIALQNFAMYSLIFELPQMAFRLFRTGAAEIGSALFATMATMVITAPFAGRATDRFGPRPIALIGSLAGVAGMLIMAYGPFESLSDAVLPLIVLGFGLGAASAPAQVAAIGSAPRERSGMASGVASTMRYLGAVVGLATLGFVLSENPAPEIARAEHEIALHVFAASLGLAALCSLLLPGRAGEKR